MQDRSEENQASEVLGDQVMDSLGMNGESGEAAEAQADSGESTELPKYAKEKLGMQEKRHKKQMRELQQQMEDMRSQLGSRPQMQSQDQSQGQSNQAAGDPYQHAVAAAMQAIEQKQKKSQEAEKMQHVHKQYQDLQDDLDNGSDQYDDFDDVVRSPKTHYTEAMRDAALLIPNRTDVLYKLGKNPDELNRISKLHPLEQAKEMVKLSIAMMGGNGSKPASQAAKTMGNIKSNPVSSSSAQVNEKTPIGEIRRKMKAGWK